ncbi:RHS repeat-associated core domain-containing protein [Candidatus Amarolinea aalborgensis]|uniref:RHS repeat-associated core domain-containing protein n=1 Tax=Candidatus Amarolinea aalborgensis TaxID=2249329 RepID=UPI003BF97616
MKFVAEEAVNGVVRWLATDHLGSTAVTANETGARIAELSYKPWGESRYSFGATPTLRRFTGQVLDSVGGGLYFYNARYYDPALGRFIQADTIVPQPGNPQSLNRYSYVRNNPLRYTDPTGNFTDDAIKAYLQSQYDDAWEQYWKAWLADETWMNLLHAAQGGDTLLEVGWESGSLGLRVEDHSRAYLRQFRLQGKGHDILSGISLEQTAGTPGPGNVGSLQDLYAAQPGGLAVLSSQGDDGNMTAIATWGDAQIVTSQVTRNNVRFQKAFQWGFNALVTEVFPPWVLADVAQAWFDPDISSLPGFTEGDRTLMVQLAVDVQGHRLTAGYSSMFRGSTNLYGAWSFGATWSPTLPPK